MRRLSFRATRFAVRVPPTPPPRTTTRCTGLPRLRDDDLVEAVLRLDAHQRVAGLLDPLRDVDLAALVGRPDGDRVADVGLLDRADELHERPRTEAAAGVDGSGDGRSHAEIRSFHADDVGASGLGRGRARTAAPGSGQMKSGALPSVMSAMTVAAPTGSPIPSSMSSRLRPNMSMVIWQGMNSTPISMASSSSSFGLATLYCLASLPIIQGPMPRKFILDSLRCETPGRCMADIIFCITLSPVMRF